LKQTPGASILGDVVVEVELPGKQGLKPNDKVFAFGSLLG